MSPVQFLGPYQIDPVAKLLLRAGTPVALGPRAVAVLQALVARPGLLVTKEELFRAAWPGLSVEDSNLTVQVAALRRALANGVSDRWIETLPRRGYRYVGPIASSPMAVLPHPEKPSVAVLPFTDMTGEADPDHLGDGVVEEIITALSRFRQIVVTARNSSFAFKSKEIDTREVGRALGVRYVLTGSIRRSSGRLRITGQLIEAAAGRNLWSDRFDGGTQDIFELQDQVTAGVIGAIEPTIRQAEIERCRGKRPEDLDAYDCVMRAMPAFWSADAAARIEALRLLEQAITIDPRYALPKALAAWCHAQNVGYHSSLSTMHERSEAVRLAEEAARLDGDDPMVLTVLGAVYAMTRRWQHASSAINRALLLNPNSAWTLQRGAWNSFYNGQYDEAVDRFRASIRASPLDPLNYNASFGIGCAFFGKECDEAAVEWLEAAMATRPSATFVHRVLASALAHLGRVEEARRAADTFLAAHPGMTVSAILETLPMNSPSYVERFAEGMRKSGIPE